MIKAIQIIVVLLFASSNYLVAQKLNYETLYKGGEDSLIKDLAKNIIRPPFEIRDDYVFHLELTVDKKGFKSAREISKPSNDISSRILLAIQKTDSKWNKSKKKLTKIVIPVILEVDKESSKHPLHFKVTEFYSRTEPVINCYLMSPVYILLSYSR